MKESLRRVILFSVIVIAGSVMILFDVPLIILVPLILATGFVVLVLLGAVAPAEIKSIFRRPRFKTLKKIAFFKRLDEMKFLEKKPVKPHDRPVPPKTKEESGFKDVKKNDTGSPLRSFFSSLGSLGSVIKERRRQKKKVEHINELLDKAVSGKVKGSALSVAAADAGSGRGTLGGGEKQGLQEQPKDIDPFMSLSGDEFDVSLLDGLDGAEPMPPLSSPPEPLSPAGPVGPDLAIQEPDISLPSLDTSSQADDILRDNAGVLEEFSALEGGESIDQDFRDLDNLDFDDADLDIDAGDEIPAAADGSSSAPATIPEPSVKTDWVPSDAPKDAGTAEDQVSLQSDMSSFSKGVSASDEDLLSSLQSDVKRVTKERDLSLLRDLKDFRAPATEIEHELKDTFETLRLKGTGKKKTGIPPAKEMK
jgi:hypothetical protein